MNIGLILALGRTDKYGYQYNDITNVVLDAHEDFGDHIIAVASSKYVDKELFIKRKKIEFISTEKTRFQEINGSEIFSFKILNYNVNYAKDLLKEEGFDIAMVLDINQYVPESSEMNIKKDFQKMLDKNREFSWIYKKYLCGNLLFYPDRRIPWIFNLEIKNPWQIMEDAIIHQENGEIKKMQPGFFKRKNNQAIRDVSWEYTLQDAKEKFENVIEEYRKKNNTFNPKDLRNMKYQKDTWLKNHQRKINRKRTSNEKIDEIGEKILSLRKDNFISHIFEKNYNYEIKKKIFS